MNRSGALSPALLPAHFQVPFLGLLALLTLGVYELLLPADRALWVMVAAATLAGVYLRPAVAAGLGWVLVLVLGAYLAVNTALSPVSGASWLTLLVVPWLPPFSSNVADFVRQNQRRLERQRELIEAEAALHPVTNLPGASLAAQFLPRLNANVQRLGHTGLLIEVHVTNLAVLRSLYSPDELGELLVGVNDALRRALRSSDWLFQVADDTTLIFADLGQASGAPESGVVSGRTQGAGGPASDRASGAPDLLDPDLPGTDTAALLITPVPVGTQSAQSPRGTGQQVVLSRIGAGLAPLKQIETEVRVLPLRRDLAPTEALLQELRAQPLSRAVPASPAAGDPPIPS